MTRNGNSSCQCEVCYCGPDCQCTETLCRCEASSVLNSLTASSVGIQNRGASRSYNTFDKSNGSPGAKQQIADIGIRGMTCSMCTRSVETALSAMNGVSSANVSLALNSAHVEFDSSKTTYNDIVETIEDIGYDVVRLQNSKDNATVSSTKAIVEFIVSGMTCSMCTQSVTKTLELVPGAVKVVVTLSTNQARVEFDPLVTSIEVLKEAIEAVGYDVVETHSIIDPSDSYQKTTSENRMDSPDRIDRMLKQQEDEVINRKRAFVWSLVGTLPILVLTMVLPHFPTLKIVKWLQRTIDIKINCVGEHTFVLEALILWALCTPIQFGCGYPFYKSTYYGLRQGVMGMDVLVAVGTTASYGYAVWATIIGSMEYHFFETSAVLICFVLLGKWMQTLAVRRTSQALTHLLQLQPKTGQFFAKYSFNY